MIPRIAIKCLLSNFTCATEVPLLKGNKKWSKKVRYTPINMHLMDVLNNLCHDTKGGGIHERSNIIHNDANFYGSVPL